MTEDLRQWRNKLRGELVTRRIAMPPSQRRKCSEAITRLLTDGFAGLQQMAVGGYWPFRGEFDPRPAMRHLRARGARLGLPVIDQKGSVLQYREWRPGGPMRTGLLGLREPEGTPHLSPQAMLLPLVGFDARGYRLGLGGGYFDRTLASLNPQPIKVGIGFELSRMPTIQPQPHDVPMDFIVTEVGVHHVGSDGLVLDFRTESAARGSDDGRRPFASPVCYAQEFESEGFRW